MAASIVVLSAKLRRLDDALEVTGGSCYRQQQLRIALDQMRHYQQEAAADADTPRLAAIAAALGQLDGLADAELAEAREELRKIKGMGGSDDG